MRHPHAVDPENPAHWPWNVARPVLFPAPVAAPEEAEALADLPPIVEGQCATRGCDCRPAGYRPTTHAALEHFCERCRHNARARVSRLRQPIEVVTARMRAGVKMSTATKAAVGNRPRTLESGAPVVEMGQSCPARRPADQPEQAPKGRAA